MLVLSVLNVFCTPNPVDVISYTFSTVPAVTAPAFNAYVVTASSASNSIFSSSVPLINLLLLLTMYSAWSYAFGSHIAISLTVAFFVAFKISNCVAVELAVVLYNANPTLTVFCNPDAESPVYVLAVFVPFSITCFVISCVNTCTAEF